MLLNIVISLATPLLQAGIVKWFNAGVSTVFVPGATGVIEVLFFLDGSVLCRMFVWDVDEDFSKVSTGGIEASTVSFWAHRGFARLPPLQGLFQSITPLCTAVFGHRVDMSPLSRVEIKGFIASERF